MSVSVQPALSTHAAAEPAARRVSGGWTATGIILFVIALLLVASAFPEARLKIAGLLVHPYLFPTAAMFAALAPTTLGKFPKLVMAPLVLFVLLYFFSAMGGPGWEEEVLKVGAVMVTIFTVALLVRTKDDFRLATIAFVLAIAVLSARALLTGTIGPAGLNPMSRFSTKNSFSLYALPSVLLGAYLIVERKCTRAVAIVLAICLVLTTTVIAITANRSGWLGVILIVVMLYGRRRRLRSALFVALTGIGVYYMVAQWGASDVIEARIEQTLAGYSSDELRENLFIESVRIGLENPLLGISPQRLPYELAFRVHFYDDTVDPHNVFGLIIGGSGLIAFALFIYGGWSLWKRPKWLRDKATASAAALDAHGLLRMMLALFFVRGMFSREIIYIPGFAMGLGLAIGLSINEGVWSRPRSGPSH